MIEMLFIGKLKEEIEKEVIRKNIHVSLRPWSMFIILFIF